MPSDNDDGGGGEDDDNLHPNPKITFFLRLLICHIFTSSKGRHNKKKHVFFRAMPNFKSIKILNP